MKNGKHHLTCWDLKVISSFDKAELCCMTKARTDAALRLKNKINMLYGWLRKYNKRYAYSEEMYSYTKLDGLWPWTWRDEPCPHQRSYNRAKHRNHHKEQVSRTSPTPCNERRLYQSDKEIKEIKQFHGYLLIFFDDLYKKHYMLSKLCDESSKDLSTHPIKYSYMPILKGENIITVEIGCEISTISKFLTTQYHDILSLSRITYPCIINAFLVASSVRMFSFCWLIFSASCLIKSFKSMVIKISFKHCYCSFSC